MCVCVFFFDGLMQIDGDGEDSNNTCPIDRAEDDEEEEIWGQSGAVVSFSQAGVPCFAMRPKPVRAGASSNLRITQADGRVEVVPKIIACSIASGHPKCSSSRAQRVMTMDARIRLNRATGDDSAPQPPPLLMFAWEEQPSRTSTFAPAPPSVPGVYRAFAPTRQTASVVPPNRASSWLAQRLQAHHRQLVPIPDGPDNQFACLTVATKWDPARVRHAIIHWLQAEQHRELLALTNEEVTEAWKRTRSSSWDEYLAALKSPAIVGDGITLLASSHVYKRSIFILDPLSQQYTRLPRCPEGNNRDRHRIVLVTRDNSNFDVALLLSELNVQE